MNNERALPDMSLILSVQSHVAYGYVGNCAAIPPLQALGHDVIALNTVHFSNHTGYGDWRGRITALDELTALIEGIKARGLFPQIDAVLTGYMGDSALGALVLETLNDIRKENPACLYGCDPVMGDVGRGFFVRDDVPEFFKDQALHAADILIPNQFEASYLSGVEITDHQSAMQACAKLHQGGARTVLMTSYHPIDLPLNEIAMLLSDVDAGVYVVKTPRFSLDPMPNGAGDVTAATFLGHIVKGCAVADALGLTAGALHALFTKTNAAARRELCLPQMGAEFAAPSKAFAVERLH